MPKKDEQDRDSPSTENMELEIQEPDVDKTAPSSSEAPQTMQLDRTTQLQGKEGDEHVMQYDVYIQCMPVHVLSSA